MSLTYSKPYAAVADATLTIAIQIIEDDTYFYLLFDEEASIRGARKHFDEKMTAGYKLPVQTMERPYQSEVDAMPDDTEETHDSRASGEDYLHDRREPYRERTRSPAQPTVIGEGRRWNDYEVGRYPYERDSREHNGYARDPRDREEDTRYRKSTVQIYDYRDEDRDSRACQPHKGDSWRPDDDQRDAWRHASRDRSEGAPSRSQQAKELDDGWGGYDAMDKQRRQEQVQRDWAQEGRAMERERREKRMEEREQRHAEREAARWEQQAKSERRRELREAAERARPEVETIEQKRAAAQAAAQAAALSGPSIGAGWGQPVVQATVPTAPVVAQHANKMPLPPMIPARSGLANGRVAPAALTSASRAHARSAQLPSFRSKAARPVYAIKTEATDALHPTSVEPPSTGVITSAQAGARKDSPVRDALEKSPTPGRVSGSDAIASTRQQSRKKQRRAQPAASLSEASASDDDDLPAARPARRFSAKPKKAKRARPLPSEPTITWTTSEDEEEEKEAKQGNGEDRIRASSDDDASDSELERAEKARKAEELAATHPGLLQGVDIVLPAPNEAALPPSIKAETAADLEAPLSSPLSSPPIDIIPLPATHQAETDAVNVVELVLPAPEKLPPPSVHADLPKRDLEESDAVAAESAMPLSKRARLMSPSLPVSVEAVSLRDDATSLRRLDIDTNDGTALLPDAVDTTLADDLMVSPAQDDHEGIADVEEVVGAVGHAASAPASEPAKKKSRARAPAKGSKKGSKKGRKGTAAATAVPVVAQPPITRPSELGITASEDAYYLKLALSRLRQGHDLLPPEQPVPHEHTAEARHEKGCARAEGFYRIPQLEKLSYLAARNQARVGETAGASTSASAIAVSRLARANARQFASGLDKHKKATASDTDLLQFNQLKSRKKQMRFARSPIHDWGLYALEHIPAGEMVIEYVGESIRQQVADHREKAYERMGIGSSYLLWVDPLGSTTVVLD